MSPISLRLRCRIYAVACFLPVTVVTPPAAAQQPVDTGPEGPRPDCVLSPRPECIFTPTELNEALEVTARTFPPGFFQHDVLGTVRILYIIDTTGHVEPSSLAVLAAPDSGLAALARQFVLSFVFKPALLYGRRVRVKVIAPVQWSRSDRP